MKKAMAAVFTAALTLPPVVAAESRANDLAVLLVAAKHTGMCGVFAQMSAFQASTQMPGGDEFVLRFLATEVARMGTDEQQFLSRCETTTALYQSTMEALQASD